MAWVVIATPRPIYPRKRPVPIVQEAGWAPGPVWTGAENLTPTGIRSPDRPARSAAESERVFYFTASITNYTAVSVAGK